MERKKIKLKIEIDFEKIGEFWITPEIIAKEKGLPNAITKCLTDLAGNMKKDYFPPRKISVSSPVIIAQVTEKEAKGFISFDIIRVDRIKTERTEFKNYEEEFKRAFSKEVKIMIDVIKKYFWERKTEIGIKFELN